MFQFQKISLVFVRFQFWQIRQILCINLVYDPYMLKYMLILRSSYSNSNVNNIGVQLQIWIQKVYVTGRSPGRDFQWPSCTLQLKFECVNMTPILQRKQLKSRDATCGPENNFAKRSKSNVKGFKFCHTKKKKK